MRNQENNQLTERKIDLIFAPVRDHGKTMLVERWFGTFRERLIIFQKHDPNLK